MISLRDFQLFCIFMALISFISGCYEETIEINKIIIKKGIAYAKGREEPFSGKAVKYDYRGDVEVEVEYSEGLIDGTYTTFYNKMGHKPYERFSYKDGTLHGDYQHWDDVGCTWIRGDYCDGKPHGKWKWYYDCGPRMWEAEYYHGRLVGKLRQWYENSQLELFVEIGEDDQPGRYKYWNEDGELKASGKVDGGELVNYPGGKSLEDINKAYFIKLPDTNDF